MSVRVRSRNGVLIDLQRSPLKWDVLQKSAKMSVDFPDDLFILNVTVGGSRTMWIECSSETSSKSSYSLTRLWFPSMVVQQVIEASCKTGFECPFVAMDIVT